MLSPFVRKNTWQWSAIPSYFAPMNDSIASGARAMLEVLRKEKEQLSARLQELNEREKTILSWIEREEGPQQALSFVPVSPPTALRIKPRLRPKPSLPEFLSKVISDGIARTNEELGDTASKQGIIEGHVDLRSINATMINLMNAGEVVRKNDRWVRKGS